MAGADGAVEQRTPQADRSWRKRVSEVCDDYCRDASVHCLRHLRSQQDHPVTVREATNSNKRTAMKATAKDYCKETSLDGFKYVAEERPRAERILWTVAILASLVGCALPVYEVWHKWMTSPVIVTFADNTESVSSLPFPTVTVCPMVKYRPALVDFREALRQQTPLPEDIKSYVNTIRLLCPSNPKNVTVDEDYINETTIELLKKVAPQMTNTIECSGMDDCEQYFREVLTEEGVCYSFNALPEKELYTNTIVYNTAEDTENTPIWSLEEGYMKSSVKGGKPIRGTTIGFNRGIILTLLTNTTELDLRCRPFRGHRITLSNPAEAPQQQSAHYYLPEAGWTQMALTPRVMDTDADLRRYGVEDRHCVFAGERRLRRFATYTQANCQLECLVNATFDACGCVQFYMPREKNTPMCGLKKQGCVLEVEDKILLDQDEKGSACRCPPPCKSIHYSVEITQSLMDMQEILQVQGREENISDMYRNMSSNFLIIYFKESDFIASRRSELYGYGSFMAEVGGLLGLWNGFSILSLVELVYFFTIRLWHDTRDPAATVEEGINGRGEREEKEDGINRKKEPSLENQSNNNQSRNNTNHFIVD